MIMPSKKKARVTSIINNTKWYLKPNTPLNNLPDRERKKMMSLTLDEPKWISSRSVPGKYS